MQKSVSKYNQKAGKKRIFFIGGAVLLVIFLAVAGYMYWNASRPARILSEAVDRSFLSTPEREDVYRSITVRSINSKQKSIISVTIDRVAVRDSYESSAQLGISVFGQNLQFPGVVRYVDGIYYLKLADASSRFEKLKTSQSLLAPYAAYIEDFITPLSTNWIELDSPELQTISTGCSQQINSATVTKEDRKRLLDIIRSSEVVSDFQALPQEGQLYSYSMNIKTSGLSKLTQQIIGLPNFEKLSAECKKQLEQVLTSSGTVDSSSRMIGLGIDVDAKSKTITKLETSQASIVRAIEFSDFKTQTKPKKVSKPEPVLLLSDILKNSPLKL